jgi:hypothetical protein
MTGEQRDPSPRAPIVETTIAAPFEVVGRRSGIRPRSAAGTAGSTTDWRTRSRRSTAGTTPSRADGTIHIAALDHRFGSRRAGRRDGGARDQAGPAGEATWDEIEQGWITFVEQLRFFLERHRGEDRRTATLKVTGGPPLTPAVAALRELEGAETFFTSRFQSGLALRAPQGALVVLHAPSDGGGRIILSTYGASEAVTEALSDRWAHALAERYAGVER